MDANFKQHIDDTLANNPIVVFMKGTKTAPQCGFSARVVQIFNALNVPFHDVNIFDDDNIRSGMKEFSNWPTFPQVYINTQFVGGCDILTEMYESGELQPMVAGIATS